MIQKTIKSQLTSFLFTGFLSLLLITGYSQEFEVKEFSVIDNAVELSINPVYTVNGNVAALVKVVTNIRGLYFDTNLGIVGSVVDKDDGYWVYVQPNERIITIKHADFISKEINFPRTARSMMVFRLVVTSTGTNVPQSDLVRITFRINEPDVFIGSGNSAPIKAQGNSAVRQVPKGSHTFQFNKPGFKTFEKTIMIDKEEIIDIQMEKGASASQLTLPGFISIDSEPRGAEVSLNGQRVGTTFFEQSQLAGSYDMVLRLALHHDHTERFEIQPGETVQLPLIKLKPRYGFWSVSTIQNDVRVFLNNKPVSNAPISRTQISSGEHELLLRKEMHHDYRESFVINDGDFKQFSNIRLKEAFGKLSISSEPSGAEVFIDGIKAGITPYTNDKQPSGQYTVRLSFPLYSELTEMLEVKDGLETKRFIPLDRNFGTLTIQAEGSEIFINDKREGSSTLQRSLPPGRYTIKAVKDKHSDDLKEVFVLVGQNEIIRLNPEPKLGVVTIQTEPIDAKGAEIFINGKKRTEVTPAVFSLLIGNYKAEVKKNGFLDASASFEVKEGITLPLKLDMQTYKGSITQDMLRQRNAKIFYGTLTLAAAGAGTYFRLSANQLAKEYETATTDATKIYGQWEDNNLYSYIAFGTAVPLGVMTIIKMAKQNKAKKKMDVALIPIPQGGSFMLTYNF